ncbi:MAG TPA: ABC transporter ATP-binding protein [Candidatus Krumholzibacteriaceae bacterium]
MEALLNVENLTTIFESEGASARVVDGVSFRIGRGEAVGLVGESGCGKSVTALSIMRLIASPPGRIAGGSILFEDRDLLKLPEKEMRKVRGNKISIVFQEPLTSLNPVFTCGEQVREAIALHRKLGRAESKARTIEMLRLVRIPDPEKRYGAYPHQMSGGMRQRVMIAMALSCEPQLLIADEPTSALDVSVQGQIIELLCELQERLRMAVLLITHDLAVVAQMASRVLVMYAGVIVEEAPVRELFAATAHPYTEGLLGSIAKVGVRGGALAAIPGNVPDPFSLPPGCRFSDRCSKRFDTCLTAEPPLFDVSVDHRSRCWLREART